MMRRPTLVLLSMLTGCGPYPPEPPLAAPERVLIVPETRSFSVSPSGWGHDVERLVQQVRTFSGGRLDHTHLTLAGRGDQARLRMAFELAGGRGSSIEVINGGSAGLTQVTAIRFDVVFPPCPVLSLTGATLGPNDRRPGLGCSNLHNLASQIADPSDLLGNDASPPADGERAALAVSRYRTPPAPKGSSEDK